MGVGFHRWLVLAALGCAKAPQPDEPLGAVRAPVPFAADVQGEAVPWTHADFDDPEDGFTFALFSDLTGSERPGVFDVAVAQLNLLRPELIVNVGDLTEGAQEDDRESLVAEWDHFDARAERARAPVFYVGGNHDLWSPVQKQIWDERRGRRYYHLVYKNTLFLVLDTEDNAEERMRELAAARVEAKEAVLEHGWDALPGTRFMQMPEQYAGRIGPEQAAYFLRVLQEAHGVQHTFLLLHKAPWKAPDGAGFTPIEQALAGRPYTVFHGHVHAYGYEQRHGRDYIQLATTGGIQFPEKGRSVDQLALVTVGGGEVHIANLLMAGILDKTGRVPLGGDALCFEKALCGEAPSP